MTKVTLIDFDLAGGEHAFIFTSLVYSLTDTFDNFVNRTGLKSLEYVKR